MIQSENAKQRGEVQEIVPLLYVSDMQRSHDFYCQRLGFQQTANWSPENQLKWCRLERQGAALMLQLIEEPDNQRLNERQLGTGVVFFFNCRDIHAIREEFSENGIAVSEIETAFYGMKQLEMIDPDGYQLCFQSPC